MRLDRNRQAVVPVTLERIVGRRKGGGPSLRPVTRLGEVDQTLGGLFGPSDSPSPAQPDCDRATPPRWAK